MGDDIDVTGRKHSFTHILLSVNGICLCVKLYFFDRTYVMITISEGKVGPDSLPVHHAMWLQSHPYTKGLQLRDDCRCTP